MMTATEAAEAIRRKEISARELVSASMAAIERHDAAIHAIVSYDSERALRQAGAVDQAIAGGEEPGPLSGVPLAVKDNLCTSHGTTTCSSKALQSFKSPYNAGVVERLEAAGAIVVAKTNLDEFAMGSSTENSAFFTTCNPWNQQRVAGGSSGGSAAAVAVGMVPCSLGSDTGGSVRQPAAFCGVVGLKPTYGRVSRYGLVAFASSLDQVGPIARDVKDTALLLSVIAGKDERDATSVDEPVPDYVSHLQQPLAGVRIGVAAEYFGPGLNSEVRTAVEEALEVFRDQGARVVDIELAHMNYAVACYYVIATAEASSNLARYDGVHYGHRTAHARDLIDLYASSRQEAFGSEVKRRIMLGAYVLSRGYYEAYYLKALKVRTLIKGDFEKAFEKVDVIASPVTPTTAFGIGEKVNDPLAMYLADVYTISANLAGVPAISVPCGFDQSNLPIGLQLLGPWFGEGRLLAVAHQYQRVTDHHKRSPPD